MTTFATKLANLQVPVVSLILDGRYPLSLKKESYSVDEKEESCVFLLASKIDNWVSACIPLSIIHEKYCDHRRRNHHQVSLSSFWQREILMLSAEWRTKFLSFPLSPTFSFISLLLEILPWGSCLRMLPLSWCVARK